MTRCFRLQGHRGARGLFPENTQGGFRAAIALGLRWFEIDVGVLRDGTVVVHHDLALNADVARLDGAWLTAPGPLLKELTLAELRRFDVGRIRPGTAYQALCPDQSGSDGAYVPTLAEVLAIDHSVGWNIELKLLPNHPDWTVGAEEMVERVLRIVDQAAAADRVTLQSFDWRAPRYARRVRPGLARGWLTRAETIENAALWWDVPSPLPLPDAVSAEGGGTWTPYWEELTQDLLDRAHALDLAVIPWTVNDPTDMARLVGWGVDGLITDFPDRAFAAVPGPRFPGGRA